MWGLGCVIWEVFNGPLPQPSALRDTAKVSALKPVYHIMADHNDTC